MLDKHSTNDDKIIYGSRFMAYLHSYPRAFGGLTGLFMHNLRLTESDIPNVLATCKKLEYLSLQNCDAGIRSVLQIEHSQLAEIAIIASELDLNFQCKKIWIQPEGPKQLAPLLQNLQLVRLRFIHEECDLTWTMFFLEAAPFLKEINMQECFHLLVPNVWDHNCNSNLGDMYKQLFQKTSDHLCWEAHNEFKHYNLTKLTIEGFQAEEKFTRYIRQVMESATSALDPLSRSPSPRSWFPAAAPAAPPPPQRRSRVAKPDASTVVRPSIALPPFHALPLSDPSPLPSHPAAARPHSSPPPPPLSPSLEFVLACHHALVGPPWGPDRDWGSARDGDGG
ncbi:hypothetical protein PR202_ga19891 [Eleusine coracana subsp. coracana]|uniref:Uncharacterized protein n=1 Tax=Eleusine coracana subsp. coracana TaxID=191504 RepID=A0AAV5CVZ3_ELECO|nr:hypothetical protein PR202_ga19891 [Eleusine coracana subsp. coracana]